MKKNCNICRKEFEAKQGLFRYWRDQHLNICSYECERKHFALIIARLDKENVPNRTC